MSATTPAPAITGIHHAAYRCRDAEETRHFYEDILGLKLAAALAFDTDPAGRPRPYMHLFFEMTDGRHLAFFDVPYTAEADMFRGRDGMEVGHVAMEVEGREALEQFKRRLDDAGVPSFGIVDHGFVQSVYFWDPNGLALELTTRAPAHDAILAEEAASAHQAIRDWTEKTRALKRERLAGFRPPETRLPEARHPELRPKR